VGVGAYLAIYFDLPIKPLAIGLTVAFMFLNIIGAKETTGLQRALVGALVIILSVFVVSGMIAIIGTGGGDGGTLRETLINMGDIDSAGLLATIGMVFVSYAGLTKVASVAEEVKSPDRNIPTGMVRSLLTATAIYVIGVLVMIVVIDPEVLVTDLTPVATASDAALGWLPGEHTAMILIVIAALAAFLSTGNAGIMSASRYLLAMGRDSLVPRQLASVGRFGTPTLGVLVTSGVIILCLATLDVVSLAKLASAFQLLIFALINLAVIVMRESRIEGYDPGYRSPMYPWIQIIGTIIPFVLIGELGHLAIIFTASVVAVCLGWYMWYAHHRTNRAGAVLHWFARMGRNRFDGLDAELRSIVQERGVRAEDSLDDVIARAEIIDAEPGTSFAEIVTMASHRLARDSKLSAAELAENFLQGTKTGQTPVDGDVALPHLRISGLPEPALVAVRVPDGVELVLDELGSDEAMKRIVHRFFFLVSPADDPARHLRLLAGIAQWATLEEHWRSSSERSAKDITSASAPVI
ncbi:MAG: amino acid permease, partial [Myxococcota bacterium]